MSQAQACWRAMRSLKSLGFNPDVAPASGVLSLLCHAWLEPATALSARDWSLIPLLGLGTLGGAFFLWDAALKRGDDHRRGGALDASPLIAKVLRANLMHLGSPDLG